MGKSIFAGLLGVALAVALLAGATAQAEDLDTVKSSGELRIAMSGAFQPFSFVDETNTVVGFDVDIANEVAKRLGVKPVIITTAWDGIIAGLIANKFDTIIGSMTITSEREQAVDFAGPYYQSGRGIFVPESSTVTSLEELSGKSVGVVLGEVSDQWARLQPGWDVKTYKGLSELFLDLGAGRIDAIAADAIPVLVAIKERNEPIRQLESDQLPTSEAIGIAIRKGNPALKAAINEALGQMWADGTYEQISVKWIGRDIR